MWGRRSGRREQHVQKPRGKRHEGALPFLEAAGSRKPYPLDIMAQNSASAPKGAASGIESSQTAAVTEPTCGPATSPGLAARPWPSKPSCIFPSVPGLSGPRSPPSSLHLLPSSLVPQAQTFLGSSLPLPRRSGLCMCFPVL